MLLFYFENQLKALKIELALPSLRQADRSLAGNRWHLNCFRCNTCGTLLDSDANLLLLGDGSLICNDCTYSCSACNNKIEDLAILTGDQAFCASCFRCRNCKRKIENLRYARTSQGIFCMSCHESLMARRKKKSRAAANSKQRREDNLSGHVDKLLPALPPSAALQSVFSAERNTPDNPEPETYTELSPRPRQGYSHNDSSSRSSSRRPAERSSERVSGDEHNSDGLVLPSTIYKKNRYSVISQQSDINGGDAESFFIPLTLDPGKTSETWKDSLRKGKEDKFLEKDYFSLGIDKIQIDEGKSSDHGSATSTPHIAFREKDRSPSAEEISQIKDNLRRAQTVSRRLITRSPSATGLDSPQILHRKLSDVTVNTSSHSGGEKPTSAEPLREKSCVSWIEPSPDVWEENSTVSTSGGGLATPSASQENTAKLDNLKYSSPRGQYSSQRNSLDHRAKDESEIRPSFESSHSSTSLYRIESSGIERSTSRKERTSDASKNNTGILRSSSRVERSPSPSLSRSQPSTVTLNGKVISGSSAPSSSIPDDRTIPSRASNRPPLQHQPHSQTYMSPRPSPAPPQTVPAPERDTNTSRNNTLGSQSLSRWSQGGGDFTMDEVFARILGDPDDSSETPVYRVPNAVRHAKNTTETTTTVGPGHGRSVSENTAQTSNSPRWLKLPNSDDAKARGASNLTPGSTHEEPTLLRRQLRNTEQRVAELEYQFSSQKDLQNLIKKVQEKRKTVSALDSQTEVMFTQIEVLTNYLEKAKNSDQVPSVEDLEDSAVKDFMLKLENVRKNVSSQIERLYEDRNNLLEEKVRIMADRDRALMEFEQLSARNAQLADMNNDLTHQIQERFKSQTSVDNSSAKSQINGLGIYTHIKDKSTVSTQLDDISLRPSISNTLAGTNSYSQTLEQDANIDPSAVLSAPHVVNIRKGQATKKTFNWKKGRQTVAKGVTKGIKGAFSSNQQQQPDQNKWQPQAVESIGLPYNLTVTAIDAPSPNQTPIATRNVSNDQKNQSGFGIFKKSNTLSKSQANESVLASEKPTTLFGSDLGERADYERRQIPSVVTRCIEEVELRGMDVEGIYRKTGGNSLVKVIQDGFERVEDYDISDPGLDITAVTSVLKQYLRRLPIPLLTFDIYDRVLESISEFIPFQSAETGSNLSSAIEDSHERCSHLRETFSMLPPKHRDCLEFLIFHLTRVAVKEKDNLMSSKNLAVVFAPTIMRDTSIEREMNNMHAKNTVVQFIIENSYDIFGAP